MFNNDDNLLVNILTSLKTTSDLKWTLKSLNTEQCTTNSQNSHLLNLQKKKLLEQTIIMAIQKVCDSIIYFLLRYNFRKIILL